MYKGIGGVNYYRGPESKSGSGGGGRGIQTALEMMADWYKKKQARESIPPAPWKPTGMGMDDQGTMAPPSQGNLLSPWQPRNPFSPWK